MSYVFRIDDWSNASNHWPIKFPGTRLLDRFLVFLYVCYIIKEIADLCWELTVIGSCKVFLSYSTCLTVQGKQIRPWWPLPYNAMWQPWISQLRHGMMPSSRADVQWLRSLRSDMPIFIRTCHMWSIKNNKKTNCGVCVWIYIYILYIPLVPHEAVPEVPEGKVHINPKKHVPIGIDCDLLDTSHSMSTSHLISHATLFCWWLQQGSLESERSTRKYYKVLLSTTPYYKVRLQSISRYYKVLLHTTKYYSVLQNLQSATPYFPVLQSTTPYSSVW